MPTDELGVLTEKVAALLAESASGTEIAEIIACDVDITPFYRAMAAKTAQGVDVEEFLLELRSTIYESLAKKMNGKSLSDFPDLRSFLAFWVKIACRRVRSRMANKAVGITISTDSTEPEIVANLSPMEEEEERRDESQLHERLTAEIHSFPQQKCLVCKRYFIDNEPQIEIARSMDLAKSTVNGHIKEAKKVLQKVVSEWRRTYE